jgi:hypothetical protein
LRRLKTRYPTLNHRAKAAVLMREIQQWFHPVTKRDERNSEECNPESFAPLVACARAIFYFLQMSVAGANGFGKS